MLTLLLHCSFLVCRHALHSFVVPVAAAAAQVALSKDMIAAPVVHFRRSPDDCFQELAQWWVSLPHAVFPRFDSTCDRISKPTVSRIRNDSYIMILALGSLIDTNSFSVCVSFVMSLHAVEDVRKTWHRHDHRSHRSKQNTVHVVKAGYVVSLTSLEYCVCLFFLLFFSTQS